ncbi:solute carrier family 23 protein [Komagataeibacter rhaeticus]|nr:solute carrier family 23 protein [Komagataeibacter rhaeticus]
MAVAGRPPLRTPDGQIPHARRAFIGDAMTAMLSAVLGTSTAGVYLESSAGIESGGRTGLTGVVIAFLFFICLFLWPLFTIIPAQATAPALVMVGLMMLRGIAELDTGRPENWLPPLLITVIIATTTNLMIALASGCLVYTLVVAAQRQWQRLSPSCWGWMQRCYCTWSSRPISINDRPPSGAGKGAGQRDPARRQPCRHRFISMTILYAAWRNRTIRASLP